ncbi:MAG: extracellular solute-binding protein [Clostridiales bacterium]|nr:extracellular solute-binding protein [Clostridiales bacterium]
MKKFVSILLILACALPVAACKKHDPSAVRLWCLQPQSITAEEEVQRMLRLFDADAHVSFVPASELNMRLKDATERGEAPDVFMTYGDALPDMAENKDVLDLSNYLPLSNVETDELTEASRRACAYQGKTWGVPLFADAYMLATNRALVATPPQTSEQAIAAIEKLGEQGMSSFDKLPPEKQSVLFEAILREKGGDMLNARRTHLAFASPEGAEALKSCTTLLQDMAEDNDAIGSGKAAFSIMTAAERRAFAEKYPDAEIELSSLFGYDRLQTVAVAISDASKNQKRAFRLLEYLQTHSGKLAALYKCYTAEKDLQPAVAQDKEAVLRIASARPAPDLCGFASLESAYLPAAIEKAGKGVPATDALAEAEENAKGVIWKGKRE